MVKGIQRALSKLDLTSKNYIFGLAKGSNINTDTTLTGLGTTISPLSVVQNYITLIGNQTIAGVKTFSETIVGSISGNAVTVTDGVYTSGNQTISDIKTFTSSPIVPSPTTDYEAATKKYVDDNAGGSGLPLFAPLYLDYIPTDAAYVLSDGVSYVSGLVYTTAYAHLLADYNASTDTTEVVGGVTVTYRRAADGHKIIDVANIANYSAVLAATGTAWYYVLDQINTRFILPFSNWFIQSGGGTTYGSMATYQSAGLPNVTGYFSALLLKQNISTTRNISEINDGGAFHCTTTSDNKVDSNSTSGSSYTASGTMSFNSSLSNSIYGSSITVQPKANKLGLFFVCGNTVTNTYLIDAAGLATKELSNLNISLAQNNLGLKDPGDIMPNGSTNFKLANNATDPTNDIDIYPGYTTASSGDAAIILPALMTKRLDANWVAGTNQGGLATGLTKTNSTWYHVYAITNPTTGTTDVWFDTSLTPTLPSGYTKSQYINSVYVQSTGIIRPFWQNGKDVYYRTGINDINLTSLPVVFQDITLSTPLGKITEAILNTGFSGAAATGCIWEVIIQNKNNSSEIITNFISSSGGINSGNYTSQRIYTNALSQIAYKAVILSGTPSSNSFTLITRGFRLI